MNDLDVLCKGLRGSNVMIEINAISHLTTYNCFLVNDIFLLSYREAEDIYNRSKRAATLAGKASQALEWFTGKLLQFIYRCCFAGQKTKMERVKDVEGSKTGSDVPQDSAGDDKSKDL